MRPGLRAATSLAGLWRELDQREQLRALLTEVYAELTEGFGGGIYVKQAGAGRAANAPHAPRDDCAQPMSA